MKKSLILLFMFSILFGCTSPNTDKRGNVLLMEGAKRKPVQSVEFFQGKYPTNYYKCIAMLSYRAGVSEELKAIDFFTRKTKTIGGDAVIMEWPPNKEHVVNNWGAYDIYYYKAMAVIWSQEAITNAIRF